VCKQMSCVCEEVGCVCLCLRVCGKKKVLPEEVRSVCLCLCLCLCLCVTVGKRERGFQGASS